jgi:hypothetical protein
MTQDVSMSWAFLVALLHHMSSYRTHAVLLAYRCGTSGLDILPWAHKAAVGEEAEATPQLFETWGAGLHVFALHQVRGG